MATSTGLNQPLGLRGKTRRPHMPLQSVNARVLVVEDHEDTRFLLRTLLESRGGISVVEANNGETAVELVRISAPDLILIDSNLPLLDGYEATRRIRELTSQRKLPIVFLSGHAQPTDQAKAFAAGCSDYLVKPFSLAKLGSLLEQHLPPGKAIR